LCAPTRSTCLTGRNHHLNGFASIAECANGFPGQHARIPDQCATVSHLLQDAGWSTFWVGKNHNVPEQDIAPGGYRGTWPLQQGFDRFYGFLGGETNQWYPDLVEDNHAIDQPYMPEEGYHLSKDLADQAIRMIRDQQASNPSKPWYMWFCPGANHAPHQAPQEYIDKYKGQFDDGYEAYREWVLDRMIAKGVFPEGTKLTEINPLPDDVANPNDQMRPWDTLNDDEKQLFRRMAEVWAGMSEYADAQIGRIVDYLEASGQLDNTLVLYAADNGTSGEGSPNGSVNENKLFNNWPDDIKQNLSMLDKLGGPDACNHFPTGWAVAWSTPFKMFKRYSEYSGGTCDPMIISWPKGIKARGEIRHQYHHSTDIVPTILEVCGLEMPDTYRGVEQYPLSGVSMRYSFDADPDGPTQKKHQYYEMMSTHGIWEDGWHAAAVHVPFEGRGRYDEDRWELYHVDEDRSESTDLAEQHPDKLEHLKQLWMDEARKNLVLPLDDRDPMALPMRTQTGKFTLCGDGLCIGRDSADAVAKEYTPETQGTFTGGTIQYVEVSVEKEQYRDLEREMEAALSVD
jgi:arylsulfatase A-like enzyme